MSPNKNRLKRLMPPKKRLSVVEQIEFLEELHDKADSKGIPELTNNEVIEQIAQEEEPSASREEPSGPEKDEEPKGPITSYLEDTHPHKRSKKAHFIVFCSVLIVGAVSFWLFNDKSFDINQLSVFTVGELEDGETDPRVIAAKEAETRVRELEDISDSEKLRNTLIINSDEALKSFMEAFQDEVGESAEVDDLYLIFESHRVLYRPGSDEVIAAIEI